MNIDTSKLKPVHKFYAAVALWVFVFYVVTGIEMNESRGFFWFCILFVSFFALFMAALAGVIEKGWWSEKTENKS